MSHYSFTPLDVGFDLRVQGIALELPENVTSVSFDADGETRTVEGSRDTLATALHEAGYTVLGYVTIETMPDCWREDHRCANNWGTYPHNGAERRQVARDEADRIVESDPDGYAHIVGGES